RCATACGAGSKGNRCANPTRSSACWRRVRSFRDARRHASAHRARRARPRADAARLARAPARADRHRPRRQPGVPSARAARYPLHAAGDRRRSARRVPVAAGLGVQPRRPRTRVPRGRRARRAVDRGGVRVLRRLPRDRRARRQRLARARPAGAFYAGYRGVSRSMIANDRRVHDAIRDVLDHEDRAALCALPRPEIQRRIRDQVAARYPDLDLSTGGEQEARWLVGKVLALVAAIPVLAVLLVIGLPWYFALRRKESTDIASAYARPVELDRAVKAAEDRFAQNQLTHLVDIKPGVLRLATLWTVLTALDVVARVYSVRGDLGGITAIHFARWVILYDDRTERDGPRRHRLLFFS